MLLSASPATMLPRSNAEVLALGAGLRRGVTMPNPLFVLLTGAGFFVAMYQWVTMIAETIR